MANTTLRGLTAIAGTTLDDTDLFLVHDFSANTEYKLSLSDLRTAVGNVGTGAFTVSSTGTSDAFIVSSSDPGGIAAPDIIFYRNSASPASNDNLGVVEFKGKNSIGANTTYAQITSVLTSPTSTTERGNLLFSTRNNGTLAERVRFRDDGGVAIGGTGAASVGLSLQKNITGSTTAYALYATPAIQSDVTGVAYVFRSIPTVANSAFTVGNITHYNATQGTIGASANVTNQYGFSVNANLIGATDNNYGFFAAASTAASVTSGKTVIGYVSDHPTANGGGTSWNFYASGTAPNYFNGVVAIGTTTPDAAAKVQINSTTQGFLPPRMNTTQRNAIATPPAGLMIYNSTTNKLNFYNGTAWEAVTSA